MSTRRSGFAGTGTEHSRNFWRESEEWEDRRKRFETALRGRSYHRCQSALDLLVGLSRGLSRMDGNRAYIELSRDAAAAHKQQREQEHAFFVMLGEFRQTCMCERKH